MGVSLCVQKHCLVLKRLHSISAARKPGRWRIKVCQLYDGGSQLGGIAALFAVHAFPCSHGFG